MSNLEMATLAGGCFWCTEAIYKRLKGVVTVKPGYSGGTVPHPTYEAVSSGLTGHAEAIQIEFDPELISFEKILEVFFKTHDPTTINRQGNDVGTQYRSIVFYHNDKQKRVTEEIVKNIKGAVTEILPYEVFYEAENYHQDYYENHKDQPYCQIIIRPKLEKLEKAFGDEVK